MDKYEDMAYMNERGIQWLNMIHSPNVWPRWLDKVTRSISQVKMTCKPEEYARQIIIEAIWHYGYAKDTTNARAMTRCARMLRQPPDRGAGADYGEIDTSAVDLNTVRVPIEFKMLDEFLDNVVGPML